MGKGSKTNCKSASHKLFKDRAKNRVDDLQGIFLDLQFARKESRSIDVTVLEEQVHQMLREWKAELNEPSPASSLQQGGSLGSFSSDICRLLQLCEEEDDATSILAAPKPEPNDQSLQVGDAAAFQESYGVNQDQHERGFPLVDHNKESPSGIRAMSVNNFEGATQLEYHQFDLHQDFEHFYAGFNGTGFCGEDALPHTSSYLPSICPPPAAFLGPKCALWDCPRPAQGLDWCQDYCSSFHAALAMNEGPPGMGPVLRPGGIGLKDCLLFSALSAKAQGKDVGIPECEGAATAKSPWNAPELFDLSVLDGESIREWLFFDKPRRAFESGNRKQRSLPDYSGRGWHESRKQVMNEFGGLKRSYYMDPQPLNHFEWHLYEYEINKCDACALYRLELKLVDGKKRAGVGIKMITGDNLFTAKAIATECGILGPDYREESGEVVEGIEFRNYTPDERMEKVDKIRVMARSSPFDKLLMVQCLKQKGHVVAVTGDGTNDAPALKEADIGLSMGIQGTEVAKESSDIIILDDNFSSVATVLRWGRCVYNNIQKFIQFQLTVNVAALVINFIAAVSAGEVPLTAVQLLWVNLIMDTLGALALATDRPTKELMQKPPVGRTEPLITNIMWRNLLAQALYQIAVLLILEFRGESIFNVSERVKETLIFNTFVLCQVFNEFNARKLEKQNVFEGILTNKLFLGIVGITIILQVVMVEFLKKFADTEKLKLWQWGVCIVLAAFSWPIAWFVKLIPVPDKPFFSYLKRSRIIFTIVKQAIYHRRPSSCILGTGCGIR